MNPIQIPLHRQLQIILRLFPLGEFNNQRIQHNNWEYSHSLICPLWYWLISARRRCCEVRIAEYREDLEHSP
jgi:hypothetical protein